MSMGNLAEAYGQTGDNARAVALYEQLLAAFRRVYGMEGENTLMLMSNLASSYINTGDFARGLQLMEEVFTIRRRVQMLAPLNPALRLG